MSTTREEDLFTRALELPAGERADFLKKACGGDEALRASVEELLAAYEVDSAVIDIPSEEAAELSAEWKQSSRGGAKGEGDDDGTIRTTKSGKIRIGDYVLEEEIARGAMGIVYRATQKSLKRKVAVKMIRSAVLGTEEDVARFKTEAEAAGNLSHPNIVPIYEVGECDGQHYYSMKLIEGGTLSGRLEELRKDPKKAAKLMATIARAIHAAHRRGTLHRDIKPGNILLDEDGEPHVTDFGLAKQIESNSSMTVSGQIMGTPYYMAPEQAEGGMKDLTTAADVYSLGAVLYQVITGRVPHKGESLIDTLKLVVEREPVAPRAIGPSIDRDLETIVLKCLDKDPERRYPSAAGLANDLDRWLRGEPVAARQVGSTERLIKWARRRPVHATAWSLAAAFLLTLGIGGPIVAYRQADLRREADAERHLAIEASALADRRAAENRRNLYFAEMILASQAAAEPGGMRRVRDLTAKWVPAEGEIDRRGWEWNYLDNLTRREISSFDGEWGSVVSAAWSPDGSRVASVGKRGTILIREVDSGEVIMRIDGPNGLSCLAWSPGGEQLVTGNGKGRVRLWDVFTGEPLLVKGRHEGAVGAVAWSADGSSIASGAEDGVLLIYDQATLRIRQTMPGNGGFIQALAWSPDGSFVASAGGDKFVRIWSVKREQLVREIFTGSQVQAVAWSPDGKMLAFETVDAAIAVQDARSGDELFLLSGHDGKVADLEWSPDSRRLASAGWDGTARIWDIETGKLKSKIRTLDKVDSVSWGPYGQRVACVIDFDIKIFDAGREETPILRGHTSEVTSVQWSSGGERLLSADYDYKARIWRVEDGVEHLVIHGHQDGIKEASWSPDERRVACAYTDGHVAVYDGQTGETLHLRKDHELGSRAVAWSPDGKWLASLGEDRRVCLRECDTFRTVATLVDEDQGLELTGNCLAWSPDGAYLAAGAMKNTLLIWEAETFKLVRRHTVKGPKSITRAVEWSPGGDRLAISRTSGTIQIIDAREGAVLVSVVGHNSETTALAWSPNGRRLVSGGLDRSLRVWDTVTGFQCLTLLGHDDAVRSVSWSPDGSRIASASYDETIRIWDSVNRHRSFEKRFSPTPPSPGAAPKLTGTDASASAMERFQELGQQGDWKGALALVPEARSEAPKRIKLHLQASALYLYLEDIDAYRSTCAATLALAERQLEKQNRASIAEAGLLMRDALIDVESLAALIAEVQETVGPDENFAGRIALVRALAACRTGRMDEAIAVASEERGLNQESLRAQLLLVEAIANAELGKREEAREIHREAVSILDQKFSAQEPDFGERWHQWLIGRILEREARELVESAD